jgi:hypothetical protein
MFGFWKWYIQVIFKNDRKNQETPYQRFDCRLIVFGKSFTTVMHHAAIVIFDAVRSHLRRVVLVEIEFVSILYVVPIDSHEIVTVRRGLLVI